MKNKICFIMFVSLSLVNTNVPYWMVKKIIIVVHSCPILGVFPRFSLNYAQRRPIYREAFVCQYHDVPYE